MIKRALPFLFAMICVLGMHAQTTIDKPAATIKLTRQEVISVRQIKADVERLEKAAGVKLTADQIRQVLDSRVNSLLFLQYCEKEKITVSDTQINSALSQMKASLGAGATDANLESALLGSGVFVEPRVYLRQRLLFESYIQIKRAGDLKAAQVPPTADEVLKAYDLAKASLVRPDTMRVSVIYVDTRGKSEADAKKAKGILQDIAAALKVNPAKFDEYALRASDTSGYRAVPSLYIEKTSQNRSLYGAELFEAIFRLKAGDVSGMVETPTGFRIVRANEFLEQKQLTLSDTVPGNPGATIQEYLAYQLAMEKQAKFMSDVETELITRLKADASIKIYEDNLKW